MFFFLKAVLSVGFMAILWRRWRRFATRARRAFRCALPRRLTLFFRTFPENARNSGPDRWMDQIRDRLKARQTFDVGARKGLAEEEEEEGRTKKSLLRVRCLFVSPPHSYRVLFLWLLIRVTLQCSRTNPRALFSLVRAIRTQDEIRRKPLHALSQ